MLPEHKKKIEDYISSHNGKPLDRQKMLQPNEMVAKVMLARYLHMTPEQQSSLAQIVTPQTIDALKILMPGIVTLLEKKQNATAG
jgi:hypothetical protein